MNKKITLSVVLSLVIGGWPFTTQATTPAGYTPISWVSSPGISSYVKAPMYNGYSDYVTTIDLSKNQIKLMATSTPRTYEGPAVQPFDDVITKNWLFRRTSAEAMKTNAPEASFVWNAPFFNINMTDTVLSLGLKSTDGEGDYITSGGRPANDMAEARRMIIIDNKLGTATIADFNEDIFVSEGDQAVEGFHPLGSSSSKAEQAARVYLGVKNNGKELVVYCSKGASKEESSDALLNAGVPVENQMQVDGGGSATCGYNLPGQYFVEPGRALPHLMGAISFLGRATVITDGLNVRTGPGSSNAAVRKLPINSTVTVYEEKSGWYRISGTEWVLAQYVKMIKTLPYTAKVNISELNVRKGAGSTFVITRKVKSGTAVTVYEEKNGWARISETEWVMMQYIK